MTDTLVQLTWLFMKLGLLTIGGSDAVLSELQRDVVAHGWLNAAEFAEAYALARVAPGPGGLVAFPVGYLIAGWPGAILATVAFVLPTLLLALALLRRWRAVRHHPTAQWLRTAVLPLSAGLTLATVWVMGTNVVHDWRGLLILALTAGLASHRTVPPVALPLFSGLVGLVLFHRL